MRQLLSPFCGERANSWDRAQARDIRPEPKPLYRLALTDASGEAETFHATEDHPWKVEGWVETADLKAGDRIDTASGADMVVTSLTLTSRVEQTYNLTVADWHTFMVGEDQAVVHNVDCKKGLRAQLEAHKRRLADYKANPAAHDNKGFIEMLQPRPSGEVFMRVGSKNLSVKSVTLNDSLEGDL